MITAIYSLSFVHGSELWLMFWLVCVSAYIGICFMMKPNRSRKAIKTVFLGLLVAEVIIEIVWSIIYYHNGTYSNCGIGAIYGLLLWIPALVFTSIIVTAKNIKR